MTTIKIAALGTATMIAIAQYSAFDLTAVIGYSTATGIALIGLYSKWRETKRQQDSLDSQESLKYQVDLEKARKENCTDKLATVLYDLGEAKAEIKRLWALVDSYKTAKDATDSDAGNSPSSSPTEGNNCGSSPPSSSAPGTSGS